jgi:hypothetical protein
MNMLCLFTRTVSVFLIRDIILVRYLTQLLNVQIRFAMIETNHYGFPCIFICRLCRIFWALVMIHLGMAVSQRTINIGGHIICQKDFNNTNDKYKSLTSQLCPIMQNREILTLKVELRM